VRAPVEPEPEDEAEEEEAEKELAGVGEGDACCEVVETDEGGHAADGECPVAGGRGQA